MDSQWVALHKNVSAEARLDRKLKGRERGDFYHLMFLSRSRLLAHSLCLIQYSTNTWTEPSTQWCLSQLRGPRFVEKAH